MPTRAQYDLQRRNQANLKRVTDLLSAEAQVVIGKGKDLAQQEMGGFLRTVVPGLVDRYGKVNAAVALRYYEEQRLAWLETVNGNPTTSASRNRRIRQGQSLMADRLAKAKTQGQLYVAQLPRFDALAKSEPIIGYGMALFQESGFDAMNAEVGNALTRAVASYNRDTLLYNSALDSEVVGVQRVAEPNACDFCRMVAFDSYGGVRVTKYAVHWHNNCHCSIETVYRGDSAFRPDYYDSFDYGSATANKPAGTYKTEGWDSFRKTFSGDYVSA